MEAAAADAAQFKLGMRSLAGAVSIITSSRDGRLYGMTATAVCSACADPPTVLVCINQVTTTHQAIAAAGVFCVNVLRHEDRELSGLFSGAQKGEGRFRSEQWTRLATGSPVLHNALVSFDCRVVNRLLHGTHSIFLGVVEQLQIGKKGKPLLYSDGQYAKLASLAHGEPLPEGLDYWGEQLEPTPPKSLWELYWGFLSIGARSFGGVLPWAHRVMVEEKRWLAPGDFAEVLALCQFMPGPNVGNVSVVVGRRWFGLAGAVTAFLGLMALPLVWVFGLALLYAESASNPEVRAVVTGVGIAGGGLFAGTAFKLAKPLARKPWGVALAASCFGFIALGRVSLFAVLPVALLLGWLLAKRDLV